MEDGAGMVASRGRRRGEGEREASSRKMQLERMNNALGLRHPAKVPGYHHHIKRAKHLGEMISSERNNCMVNK